MHFPPTYLPLIPIHSLCSHLGCARARESHLVHTRTFQKGYVYLLKILDTFISEQKVQTRVQPIPCTQLLLPTFFLLNIRFRAPQLRTLKTKLTRDCWMLLSSVLLACGLILQSKCKKMRRVWGGRQFRVAYLTASRVLQFYSSTSSSKRFL